MNRLDYQSIHSPVGFQQPLLQECETEEEQHLFIFHYLFIYLVVCMFSFFLFPHLPGEGC